MMKKPPITSWSRQLPWKDTFAYALPALSLAVIGLPVYVFLPKFYTDTMGVGISTVGALLMAVRVFDAVTDPVIGYVFKGFSDVVKNRQKKRLDHLHGY